jgi:hypothetical protein
VPIEHIALVLSGCWQLNRVYEELIAVREYFSGLNVWLFVFVLLL